METTGRLLLLAECSTTQTLIPHHTLPLFLLFPALSIYRHMHILIVFIFFHIYMYDYFACTYSIQENQKRSSDPMKLKLQVVMNHLAGIENQDRFSERTGLTEVSVPPSLKEIPSVLH